MKAASKDRDGIAAAMPDAPRRRDESSPRSAGNAALRQERHSACSCGCGCHGQGQGEAPAQAGQAGQDGTESAVSGLACVLFDVPDMDCPVEAGMVRDALQGLDGIGQIAIDLERRKVRIAHDPCHLQEMALALDKLGLGARLHWQDASGTLFDVPDMDCPVEAGMVRDALQDLEGIGQIAIDLERRKVRIVHDPRVLEAAACALARLGLGARVSGEEACQSRFLVPKMDCPVEQGQVEATLAGQPGIFSVVCNLEDASVLVRHAPSALWLAAGRLHALGLGARLERTSAGSGPAQDAGKAAGAPLGATPAIPWKKILAGGLLAALAEACAFALEGGLSLWPGCARHLPWLALGLSLCAVALCGLGTFRRGWAAARHLTLNMNVLMSVAILGAIALGEYPEAAMVVVLFELAEAIEAKTTGHARDAVAKLLDAAPATAEVKQEDGSWKSVDATAVTTGSLVRVKPGERIPLDGLVAEGASQVDQSPITGESMPVSKGPGDQVFAGSVNLAGAFDFRTTARASGTTLAHIVRAVEEARRSRAPVERLVDAFARWYTPAVFLLALAASALLPLALGWDWEAAAKTSLVLLVTACPCALVISTPATLAAGMAAAARKGILVKGACFLETGRKLSCLCLDKTGTLTEGRPVQTDFARTGSLSADKARTLAFSLAARSSHPVSKAIADKALEDGVVRLHVDRFEALPGLGVEGDVDGETWRLGGRKLLERLEEEAKAGSGKEGEGREGEGGEGALSPAMAQVLGFEAEGKTPAVLAGPGGAQAVFAVADGLRETSAEAVAALRRLGVASIMLTGDSEQSARAIAKRAGINEARGALLPQDKIDAIAALKQKGACVGMVGDGINDAPALALADIGFAMGACGTAQAIETADVALMDDDLGKVPQFIRLARGTFALVAENIVFALGVKAAFFGLAFAGIATMWMAVFADVGTTVLVVLNGLRALGK